MYLDASVDTSEWIHPASGDYSQLIDNTIESMRNMGVLSSKVSSSNKAAAIQLELHPPFRQQLRQALAVRDTSPWKEQVNINCQIVFWWPAHIRSFGEFVTKGM